MGVKETDSLRLQLQREVRREFRNYSRSAGWRLEAGRKQLRLDSIPPDDNSGMIASKKLELPTARKDDLQAPGKKSGSTVKKEKPKQMPPKVKGAELWRDCPAEFLKYAKEGMVSARVSIPGPGFVLKEAGFQGGLFITEAPEASEKLDSASQSSSNTRSKSNRISSKPKGKSK